MAATRAMTVLFLFTVHQSFLVLGMGSEAKQGGEEANNPAGTGPNRCGLWLGREAQLQEPNHHRQPSRRGRRTGNHVDLLGG